MRFLVFRDIESLNLGRGPLCCGVPADIKRWLTHGVESDRLGRGLMVTAKQTNIDVELLKRLIGMQSCQAPVSGGALTWGAQALGWGSP